MILENQSTESSSHFLITKLSRFMFMDLQIVAVKQLDRNGLQGNREFLVEVLMLSLLHHTNLVNLIGYCADGDQRLLVYEYMALGSLEDHLHGNKLINIPSTLLPYTETRALSSLIAFDILGQFLACV